mgnify:FL=1
MEHFAVIQSIVRAGLAGDPDAVDKQVLRLRERLEKAGATKEAATLERLRAAARDTQELAPSRVEMSRGHISGEVLEQGVNPPIDRETGARLCTVDFPGRDGLAPVYRAVVSETVEGLLREWASEAALQEVGVAHALSVDLWAAWFG